MKVLKRWRQLDGAILKSKMTNMLCYSDTSGNPLNKYRIRVRYGYASDMIRIHIWYVTWHIVLFYSLWQRIQYPIQDNMFQYDLVRTHFWFVYDTVICSFQLVDTLEDTQIIVADPSSRHISSNPNQIRARAFLYIPNSFQVPTRRLTTALTSFVRWHLYISSTFIPSSNTTALNEIYLFIIYINYFYIKIYYI
jgi:hypothetical protein